MPVLSVTYKLRYLFHGGNTGSNPVGDANKTNNLAEVSILLQSSGDAVVTLKAEKWSYGHRTICSFVLDFAASPSQNSAAMKTLLLVLLLSGLALCQDKYPVSFTVRSSESNPVTTTSSTPVDTHCTRDTLGNTDCTSTGGKKTTTTVNITQIAEASDGNEYVLQCVPSAGRAFATGFAASTGATTENGCFVAPGMYSGRIAKRGVVLLIPDAKGKPKKRRFYVLAVRALSSPSK